MSSPVAASPQRDTLRRKDAEISRVRDLLEWDIAEGALAAERLPSEASLVRRYDASRNVVRGALAALVASGRIERIQGRGTVLRATPFPQVAADNLLIGAEERVGGVIVRQEIRPLPQTLAETFTAPPGQASCHTEWVARTPSGPLEFASVYLLSYRAEPLCFTDFNGDLFEFLAAHMLHADRGEADIYASAADPWVGRWLGVDAGTPVLVTQGVQRDAAGEVIAAGTHTFRSERVRMRFHSA